MAALEAMLLAIGFLYELVCGLKAVGWVCKPGSLGLGAKGFGPRVGASFSHF